MNALETVNEVESPMVYIPAIDGWEPFADVLDAATNVFIRAAQEDVLFDKPGTQILAIEDSRAVLTNVNELVDSLVGTFRGLNDEAYHLDQEQRMDGVTLSAYKRFETTFRNFYVRVLRYRQGLQELVAEQYLTPAIQ